MASARAEEDLGAVPDGMDVEEKFHGRGRGGRGRGRGKGRGGRGGGAGGREMDVSRALSKLLRHAAEEQGIKLDEEGYASLEKVVSLFLFLI